MYFNFLPQIYLNVNDEYFQLCTDITVRAAFTKKAKELYSTFEYYSIADGDTPETVSYKLYDTVDYYWIILLINEIIDPRFDWCLSQENLTEYVKDKYGEENIYAIHHYEKKGNNNTTIRYATNVSGSTSISNFEYEDYLNEQKRQILIPKPEYLPYIVAQFQTLLNV